MKLDELVTTLARLENTIRAKGGRPNEVEVMIDQIVASPVRSVKLTDDVVYILSSKE